MESGDERRKREEMAVDLDTSDLIIGITQVFNTEQSYEVAMNGILEMISRVLNPERLIVFERGEQTTSCTFEWHAEGIPSQKNRLQGLPNAQFDTMEQLARSQTAAADPDIFMSDVGALKNVDGNLYRQFDHVGIQRMMAVPLFSDGKVIGYLSANNFKLEKGLDAKRLLETVGTFVSARMVNQRLVDELARTGTHDRLTGLLNRWGIDAAIAQRLDDSPDTPYVLALVDIDDFKTVNDLYGHDVGDAALVSLAAMVKEAFSETAVIGRNGGDEFLVMLFGDDAARADELLQEFSKREFYCESRGERFWYSTSIGYVGYPSQASDLHDAYTKADVALYAVKLAGKAGEARYTPAYDQLERSQFGFSARDIAENIPASFVVYRKSGAHEIMFANSAFVAMLGYDDYSDLMEGTGGSFANVVHPDDAQRVFGSDALDQALVADAGNALQYRVVAKSGAVKRVLGMGRLAEAGKAGSVLYTFIVGSQDD